MTKHRLNCLRVSFLFLSLVSPGVLRAQDSLPRKPVAFSAGMGVSYVRAVDIVDYVNQFTGPSDKLSDFTSAVEFFAAPEISLNSEFGLKLEYSYLLKSYTVARTDGTYSFEYSVHMPTALLVYVLEGDGFYVKLGGGFGYHFGRFTQLFPNSATESRFTSSGPGFKLEVMGNTAFSESLYGLIGGDLRLDLVGTLKDGTGKELEIRRAFGPIDPVRLHFFSAGIKFGLVYYF